MTADELIHYWSIESNDLSACGVDIFHTPYTYGSPEWPEVTCADCKAKQPPVTGPSVPNWIAKAVVTNKARTFAEPITGWRATKTQVIVSTADARELRFRLDDLSQVGVDRYDSHRLILAAPDDGQLAAAQLRRKLDAARGEVLNAIENVRLQDSIGDLDAVLTKLERVRQAVVRAQASLADVEQSGHVCGFLAGRGKCETCERQS